MRGVNITGKCSIDATSTDKINEDATAHSGKAFNQKTLKIYAAKANAEPMLDVARGTYKENIEDIHSCESDCPTGSE